MKPVSPGNPPPETAAPLRGRLSAYSTADQARILRAAEWAAAGPEPSRSAGVAAAEVLGGLNLDADTIIAALLQNTAPPPGETVEGRFGRSAALLREDSARITGLSAAGKTAQEAENIRRMLFAMVRDIRVIFIKLAEKLCRMRSAEELPPEERKNAAQECLDIYAPLAGRLGISWIKDELEDLSLKQINREAYAQIKEIVAEKRGERQEFLRAALEQIRGETEGAGIRVEVSSRAKHFYSIYQKMRKRNKAPGDLYDLFGIRILCDNIENCYTLLGLVHRLWKPLEGRFKDYIAMPKSNGYQSLHTTVMAGGGRLLEIQIRTAEMHHIAEYGIASHWLYKQGAGKDLVRPLDISIVGRLKDWQRAEAETGNRASLSFLEDIKREILKDSIYVFTPQGKVVELPAGAGPLDFAYSIHSAVGDHCIGAKADGAIIPLSAELANTQVVEILTSPAARPHINWLRIVKTARARSRIRAWLQENDGSLVIEKNAAAKKKTRPEKTAPEKPSPETPPPPEKEPRLQEVAGPPLENILQVRVEDEKNLMIRFARCCRPVTGDPIVGYVSRGRGIIIHRKNCRGILRIPDFEERKIETEWENVPGVLVKRFVIEARPQSNLFSEIEGALRKNQGRLIEGRLEESSPRRLTGFFTVRLERGEDLKMVLKNIRGIPGVQNIRPFSREAPVKLRIEN
jgi:GTP pyrophosphokinase